MRPIWALFPQEVHEVSYVEAVSEPDRFAEYVDQVLGTAVGIFDYSYSDHETAGLLAVSDLRYENIDQHGWHTENYDPYTAILTIDHPLLGSFTDSRREAIQNVLKLIHEGEDTSIDCLVVRPRLADKDWRSKRKKPLALAKGSAVDAENFAVMPKGQKPELRFRSKAEFNVFNGFRQKARSLPVHENLVITVNCPVMVPNGSVPEVDVVVLYKGRVAVIEVDDDTHRRANRYVADHSRDKVLRDCGIYVERVASEDTYKPKEVEALVQNVLSRLSG
jgi:hypothetical protein